MQIRPAVPSDAAALERLFDAWGHPSPAAAIAQQLAVIATLPRAAEELARGWGCDRMEVTSSRARPEAPGFYAALGYEDRSERQARLVRAL